VADLAVEAIRPDRARGLEELNCVPCPSLVLERPFVPLSGRACSTPFYEFMTLSSEGGNSVVAPFARESAVLLANSVVAAKNTAPPLEEIFSKPELLSDNQLTLCNQAVIVNVSDHKDENPYDSMIPLDGMLISKNGSEITLSSSNSPDQPTVRLRSIDQVTVKNSEIVDQGLWAKHSNDPISIVEIGLTGNFEATWVDIHGKERSKSVGEITLKLRDTTCKHYEKADLHDALAGALPSVLKDFRIEESSIPKIAKEHSESFEGYNWVKRRNRFDGTAQFHLGIHPEKPPILVLEDPLAEDLLINTAIAIRSSSTRVEKTSRGSRKQILQAIDEEGNRRSPEPNRERLAEQINNRRSGIFEVQLGNPEVPTLLRTLSHQFDFQNHREERRSERGTDGLIASHGLLQHLEVDASFIKANLEEIARLNTKTFGVNQMRENWLNKKTGDDETGSIDYIEQFLNLSDDMDPKFFVTLDRSHSPPKIITFSVSVALNDKKIKEVQLKDQDVVSNPEDHAKEGNRYMWVLLVDPHSIGQGTSVDHTLLRIQHGFHDNKTDRIYIRSENPGTIALYELLGGRVIGEAKTTDGGHEAVRKLLLLEEGAFYRAMSSRDKLDDFQQRKLLGYLGYLDGPQ